MMQGAFSLPSIVRREDVIDATELEPFCTGRTVSLRWGDVPIYLVQATEIHTGCSIQIRIRQPNSQLPIVSERDDGRF